jgi:hypothetical protein
MSAEKSSRPESNNAFAVLAGCGATTRLKNCHPYSLKRLCRQKFSILFGSLTEIDNRRGAARL